MTNGTHTTRLTLRDVQALAERLHSRAVSKFLTGQEQASDGLLAALLIRQLIVEVRELRAAAAMIAATCPHEPTVEALRAALAIDRTDERTAITIVFVFGDLPPAAGAAGRATAAGSAAMQRRLPRRRF